MILAIDVDYNGNTAVAAGVTFDDWRASEPDHTYVSCIPEVEAYIPGEFYRRELPCILTLMRAHCLLPDTIVIDGNVWLDGRAKPGLGKHLYDALNGNVKVIGVAKNAFAGISADCELLRGVSRRPLFISAEGLPLKTAKAYISKMHGEYRIPTLLKQVDRECRKPEHRDGVS